MSRGREEFSAEVIDKAERLVTLLGAVTQSQDSPDLWMVCSEKQPLSNRRRRVALVRNKRGSVVGATCTCPHGRNQADARCYHVAAVLLRLSEDRD